MIFKTQTKGLLAILFFMAIIVNAQTNEFMTAEQMNHEEKKVVNVIEKMTSDFHDKDIEGVMSSYEPGALVVFEPEKTVSDHKVLRKMFLEAFMFDPKFDFSGHEVFINGNIATHLSSWTMKGKSPDGEDFEEGGLSVAVLRKQANGEWLIILDNPHGQFLLNQ